MRKLSVTASLQNLILSLNEENLELVSEGILNSIWINSIQQFSFFTELLFGILKKRRELRNISSLLCKFVIDNINEAKRIPFKSVLLSSFLNCEDITYDEEMHYNIQFFYFCFVNCIFSSGEVAEKINEYLFSGDIKYSCIILYLLLYFGPTLKNEKEEVFLNLCGVFSFTLKSHSGFSKSLLKHWGSLPSRINWVNEIIFQYKDKIMCNEEWNERTYLLRKGTLENSIEDCILRDEVNSLQSKLMNSSFDIDNYYCYDSFSLNQEVFDFSEKMFMIQYAACVGSINCFKYLFLNKQLDDSIYKGLEYNLFGCAIKGGNIEIIRILTQQKYFSIDVKKIAFLFFRKDIFSWLHQMDCMVEDDFYETLNKIGINEVSYQSLIDLLEKSPKNERLLEFKYRLKLYIKKKLT